MSVQITRLSNGLRVVTNLMDQLETVSLGIWAAVGARHDPDNLHGISHFLEHMAFKGTAKRSSRQIAEEIEAKGGELNAATSFETTAYYARVVKSDESIALEILADILQNSMFDPSDLVKERDVIMQEIAASHDCPDDLVYDLAQEAAYPDQPLGRNILGSLKSVQAITRSDLRAFLSQKYHADRMVISAAGAVDHDTFCCHCEALFGGLVHSGGEGDSPARFRGGTRCSERPFEQCHFLIGLTAPAYGSDEFFAGQVLSGLLGGGMSSRLFQEVREKRGLCYAIYSSAWGLSDTGMMAIHAATGPEAMKELVQVVMKELYRLADEGVEHDEVLKSKAQLKAGLLMGLESSYARAEQMARHLLRFDRVITKEELIERIESVTNESVRALAQSMLSLNPAVAVVGAGKSSSQYAQYACETFAASRL